MLKKGFNWGGVYFLIGLLFAAGAISKVISADSIILAMQWFCAFVFIVLGILRLRRNSIG